MSLTFVHLNVHSNFSLLAGTRSVDELVAAARLAGMSALALTDTNGLYAATDFQAACRAADLKPLFGVELRHGGKRAVLLARDAVGYGEICRLVSRRHLDADFRLSAALAGVSDHVFVLCGDPALLAALRGRRHVYVEVVCHHDALSRRRKYRLLDVASRLGLPVVATNNVHMLRREEHRIHRVLCAIRTNTTIGTIPDDEVEHEECTLRSPGEMAALFADVPEALENSVHIAWSCNYEIPLGRPRPPRFVPPRDFPFLRGLCEEGLRERLGEPSDGARRALARELDVIQRLDLADYFLVCWDLVRFARSHGMPCLGRGSAANSLVSYCLYITHVNPLEHNLFFERFLNLEREGAPDFDIDFATDDREVVLDYIFQHYGRDHVAMISTYSTMHVRSAMREVAKAFGIPTGEVDDVIKRLPHFVSAKDVRARIASDPARRDLPLDREPFRTVLEIAGHIAEFPRHLATHPCGLVIAPEPILDIVPLQRGDKGLEITQWDMNAVEEAGLIKIDILGQKGLAVIRDTVRQVEHNESRHIDPERVDVLQDVGGRELLRTGRTVGCFYIESPIMLQLMEQAHCDDFEVLTALSSIIRPGVSNYGGKKRYLECHLGLARPEVLHPLLEPVLRDTYGCLIYQEQVIQVAVAIAGMTLSEADGLRKCMSKKGHWQRMETYRERFMTGARRRGVTDAVAAQIFTQIESFAGYAFCKAHSASFALESFASAYWKAHHPAEFMAAVLTNQGGYYTPMEYAEEARRCGVRLLPPCVNESRKEFWGRGATIRVGLMQVKGLTDATIEAILSARHQGGHFHGLGDFLRRVPATEAERRTLVRCGALDASHTVEASGSSRPRLLWELELRSRAGESSDPERLQALVDQIPPLDDWDAAMRLRAELETLELTLETHPFALFEELLAWVRRRRDVVRSVDLGRLAEREVYLLGWKVTAKRTTTVNGESMCFVTFSDEHGRFEASFFPEVYQRCARELVRGLGPFLVKGKVEVQFGVAEVVASHAMLLRGRASGGPEQRATASPGTVRAEG